jgi:pyridinium-3,5-bisthiocarboxylic acid mononucleotide nickel chelatase
VIAYLDCAAGLAGDMLVAALVDAGAPERPLREVPARLGLDGVEVVLERVRRHGISALHLDVVGGAGAGPTWESVRERVAAGDLDARVRDRSLQVLERLAEAEGTVHGVAPGDVHFHELGAADTLVDVVGTVTLIEALGVTRIECSPLPFARGLVETQHGVLPLPAPATAALLVGVPVVGVELEAELVTPTGAALAAGLADRFGPPPAMIFDRIGYGAGTADFARRANVVRVLLGQRAAAIDAAGEVTLLETNLDDLLPELVPDAVDRCYAAGALDVWTVPAAMKKGRPGVVLSALARPDAEAAVAQAILEETTALGVRAARLRRYELDREERVVEVDGRPVRVKVGRLDGRVVNVAPEHDDCAAVARASGTPVKSVWAAALAAAGELT